MPDMEVVVQTPGQHSPAHRFLVEEKYRRYSALSNSSPLSLNEL